MKRLPLLMIGLLILLTACGNASKRGEAAGHAFLAAWGDTAAMRQVVQQFNSLRNDSLYLPWESKAANRAFSRVLFDDERDSLTQACYVIVLSPRELAQLKCPQIIYLLKKKVHGTDMGEYVDLIHWLCHAVGYERHVEVFDSTMQAIVDGYSKYEQMVIYSQASRPEILGSALAYDANQPDADMVDINERIDLLKERIYTPEQFAIFEKAYKSALKSNSNK